MATGTNTTTITTEVEDLLLVYWNYSDIAKIIITGADNITSEYTTILPTSSGYGFAVFKANTTTFTIKGATVNVIYNVLQFRNVE